MNLQNKKFETDECQLGTGLDRRCGSEKRRSRYHSREPRGKKTGLFFAVFGETGLITHMKKSLALLLWLSVGVCVPSQRHTPEKVKIGVFLSLTGATASYGVSALYAIQLATDEIRR